MTGAIAKQLAVQDMIEQCGFTIGHAVVIRSVVEDGSGRTAEVEDSEDEEREEARPKTMVSMT